MSYLADLGVTVPIIQAPMAGGATTVDLATAVCHAGGLGSIAAGMLTAAQIEQQIKELRQHTDRAFMINLFVQSADIVVSFNEQMPKWLKMLYKEKDIKFPRYRYFPSSFEEQLEVVLDARPAVVSFTFGILTREQVRALKMRGIGVVGTVNHPEEAKAWASLGADALVVQGYEAGGHRGGFLQEYSNVILSLMPLLSQCHQAVSIPLWAAGGIMTGSQIVAVQTMGAQAAQLGTAFLTTKESGITTAYKAALLTAQDKTTRHTRLFSGKSARGLINKMMLDFELYEQNLPPFPIQYALTQPLTKIAGKNNDLNYMSLWAGEGVSLCRDMSVAQLITALKTEYQQAIVHLNPTPH